jgi:hypothetical protein
MASDLRDRRRPLQEVPRGGDAYLLKHVIHDWHDERAIEILNACRRAMGAEATLLLIEGVYPPRSPSSARSTRRRASRSRGSSRRRSRPG